VVDSIVVFWVLNFLLKNGERGI